MSAITKPAAPCNSAGAAGASCGLPRGDLFGAPPLVDAACAGQGTPVLIELAAMAAPQEARRWRNKATAPSVPVVASRNLEAGSEEVSRATSPHSDPHKGHKGEEKTRRP